MQSEECENIWKNVGVPVYSQEFIRIRGVPQNAYTGTENVVIRVTEALNVPVEPENVEIIVQGKLRVIYYSKVLWPQDETKD